MRRVGSIVVVAALIAGFSGTGSNAQAAEPGGYGRAPRAVYPAKGFSGGHAGFRGVRGMATYPGFGGYGYPWYYGGVFLEAVPYGGNSIVVYDHRWPSVYGYGRPYIAGFGGFVNAPVVLGAPPLVVPGAVREFPQPDSSLEVPSVPPAPAPGP